MNWGHHGCDLNGSVCPEFRHTIGFSDFRKIVGVSLFWLHAVCFLLRMGSVVVSKGGRLCKMVS